MNLDPALFSSWPEWLACGLVIVAVIVGSKFHKTSVAVAITTIVLAWIFGTAKFLILPLVLGGAAWLWFFTMGQPWRKIGGFLAIAGSLVTVLLCWLLPLPVAPPLRGAYEVGTINLELPAKEDSPRLLAQIWYPSDEVGNLPAVKWLPDSKLAPGFPYHRLAYARAHARSGVSLITREKPLPVIFYEHSWLGHRAENIVQVENLASQGFVIVAVDHPGQSMRVLYSDGSVMAGSISAPADYSSQKAAAAFQITAERCFSERMANVERVRLALKGDTLGHLKGKLDLDHVGVFGFSFGGSTALRLCAENPVFRAGANEDGLFLGTSAPHGPFLFFDQEMSAWLQTPPQPDESFDQSFTRIAEGHILDAMREPGRERVILDGTRHLSFSDRIYASPFPRLARVGTRSASEVHVILSTRLNEFFTAALNPKGELRQAGKVE